MMKRILIIDKQPFIRALLSRTLQSDDIVIAPFASFEKALAYMKSNFCDLCFLDLKLSEEDAVEEIKTLKGVAQGMKVIAMSGSYISGGTMRELEGDACLLMRKPFLPSEVRSMTCKALGFEESRFKAYGENGVQKPRERRMSERTPISRRIIYAVNVSGGEDIRENGDVINISESGMLMVTASPVAAGNQLRFTFGIEENKGAVAWSRKNENGTYSAGIVFA
ncbi:MAG: response regulator [Nitrospirota bacterium]|nr:response regulator [Nitrospirota bacterium]